MLEFRTCKVCRESHAVRRDGRMSIHTTADGMRCEEPEPKSTRKSATSTQRTRNRAGKKRSEHAQERLLRLGDQSALPEWQRDAERRAAFDEAAERKRKYGKPSPSTSRFDRTIYATGTIRTVSGGSPGGGKRR